MKSQIPSGFGDPLSISSLPFNILFSKDEKEQEQTKQKSGLEIMPTSNIDQNDVSKEGEKFALKTILRRTRRDIKTHLTEKEVMLAMDSQWHTKLINS